MRKVFGRKGVSYVVFQEMRIEVRFQVFWGQVECLVIFGWKLGKLVGAYRKWIICVNESVWFLELFMLFFIIQLNN